MKKFRLMLWMQLMMLPLIVFSSFSGCEKEEEEEFIETPDESIPNVGIDSTTTTLPSEKDSIATNPSVESKFIIYENLGSDDWTYLLVADTDNLMLLEDSLGNFVRAYGLFEGNEVRMNFDERKELFTLRIDSMYEMELQYKGDSVFVYSNNSFHSFSISELCENVTRVSNGDVLGTLFSEAIGELIPSVISDPIELMKYLYETDDMNHHEKIDYIENGDYGLVPPELLDKLFGRANEKEPEKIPPTYYIGIGTGKAEVYGTTAKCYIDGYLRADANDGEFNFDYGICLSTSSFPTVLDMLQRHTAISGMISSINVDFSVPYTFTDLKKNTTYYYRAYFKNNLDGRVEYADEIKSFKTETGESCPDDNHPHAIDLGLPSGTKWACCNVGASSPEGYGGYYAWGETEEKSDYDWDTYKYYNDNTGWVNIGSNISGTQYDVARVKWGGSWRMPTVEEIKELVNECTWDWTTYNGVNGQLVTGPNGNSIFLPAAGCRNGSSLYGAGENGNCWSSTPIEGGTQGAYNLNFSSGYPSVYWIYRFYGRSVRPVSD